MDEQIRILLVEDDPRDLQLTLRELQNEKWNARIQVARDGEEALNIVFAQGRTVSDRPHLVLLDLKLPKVDGLEVLREIKSHSETRAIPVVALTSSREEQDRIDCYLLGINGYVQKPVNFERFRATINAMGIYWLTINQPPPDNIPAGDSVVAPAFEKG